MLSVIQKYIKSAIFDPVTEYMATVGSKGEVSTAITDPTSGDQTSVGTSGELTSTLFDTSSGFIASVGANGELKSTIYDTATANSASIGSQGEVATAITDPSTGDQTSVGTIGELTSRLYDSVTTYFAKIGSKGEVSTAITDPTSGDQTSVGTVGELKTTLYDTATTNFASVGSQGDVSTAITDPVTGDQAYVTTENQLQTFNTDFLIEVAKGNVAGHTVMNKFGANPDVDTGTTPEDVWDAGGIYGFFPTTAQSMEVESTLAADTGTAVSGTATGGSLFTLEDTGATFTATVTVGDLLINVSNDEFSIVSVVNSDILLTCQPMSNGSSDAFQQTANASGDSYSTVTPASTGAATIAIYGLDGNFDTQNEIVVLNGITAVNLTHTYIRINRMAILTAGSSGGAEGVVDCQIQVGGTIAAEIINGNNQTLMCIYTIPNGKIGYFLQGYVGVTKTGTPSQTNTARFTWRAKPLGGVFNVKGIVEVISSGNSFWQYKYEGPPGIPPFTDVLIRCEDVSHSDTGLVGGFDILLVDI